MNSMKKFFVLWSSQAASMFGSAVVSFALAWYLTKETNSATVLATAMMVAMLPQIILGPFIGPFIDRWDRKKIMIFADLAVMLLTVVLVVLFYTKTVQIWHIYLLLVSRSIGGTFQYPAIGASIPMIVPEKHLARANGLFMTLQGLINIIGPPAGAFLMEALSMQWVLSVDIFTAVIAVACLLPLVIPQPPRTTLAVKANVIGDMVQGFRYIWSWRGLMILGVLFSLINFFGGPISSMLPIFVTRHLGAEVLRLGWLDTAFGVGMIAGGLILGAWGGFKRRIVTSFTGIIIAGCAVIVFGFTTSDLFLMGVAMTFLTGLGIVTCNAPISAIIQSVVAKDMQGRFGSLLGSITGAMTPLGLAIAGPVADIVGVRPIFWFAGAAILGLILAAFFSRDLMNIEKQKAADMPTGPTVPS
jgi:DHA3 family macrolide efflux protein-like MFS transporter